MLVRDSNLPMPLPEEGKMAKAVGRWGRKRVYMGEGREQRLWLTKPNALPCNMSSVLTCIINTLALCPKVHTVILLSLDWSRSTDICWTFQASVFIILLFCSLVYYYIVDKINLN